MAVESDQLVRIEKLDNGLTIVGQSMPGIESVGVSFHVKTGSRDESADIAGVSHFLEHMMFKGTDRRSATDISKEFERMGAQFNAYTWVESTVYYARVLGDQLPQAVDLLADMMRPKLDPEEFSTEKGVIIEEIARSEDQPTHELVHQLFATFFEGHPLANSVLGTTESIRELPVEKMRDYHNRRYSPTNMVMGVAGNFEWDTLLELSREKTASWQPVDTGRNVAAFTPQPRVKVDIKPQFQQEHVAIASAAPDEQSDDAWAAGLIASILGDSTGSRLFWEVTQRGMADSVETDYYGFEGTGMFLTYFSTAPDKAPETLRVVRREMDRLIAEGVTEEELERAKVKAISDTVIGSEAATRRMFEVVELYITKGRAYSVDEIVQRVESITVEDLRGVLDKYSFSGSFTVQAAGPLSEAELLG